MRLVRDAVRRHTPIVHVPPRLAVALARVVGAARGDILLTHEEVAGLMSSLLTSAEPPRGRESFRDWLAASGSKLGRRYVSELARNYC